MKIIKLYSSDKSFKTINFNETGFSFICGIESSQLNQDKSTYNGVGKTLALRIIDFCLCSTFDNEFKKLKTSFFLEIKIEELVFTIQRDTNNSNNVYLLNSEKKLLFQGLDSVKDFLNKKNKIRDLKSIRMVLPYFIRYKRSAFIEPIMAYQQQQDVDQLLSIFYLLGFDLSLIINRITLSDKLKNLRNAKNQFKDPEIKNIFLDEDYNSNVEINVLQRKLDVLELKYKNFKIADNLTEKRNELYKYQLTNKKLTNKIFLNNHKLDLIKKGLEQTIEIGYQEISEMYGTLIKLFSEKLLNTISDVQKFHDQLMKNRIEKLNYEKLNITKDNKILIKKQEQITEKINMLYEILNNYGEFQEYIAIKDDIFKLKEKINKYQEYSKIGNSILKEKIKVETDIKLQDQEALAYLSEIKEKVALINDIFTANVNSFFPENIVSGTLKIELPKTASSKQQFKIAVNVSYDGSEGIGSSRILCFDMLLLLMGKTAINFIIHDSAIFNGIDHRYTANYLKYLFKNYQNKYQLIFTINQSDMEILKTKLGKLYEDIIERNVVLKLDGELPNGFLLGKRENLNFKNN